MLIDSHPDVQTKPATATTRMLASNRLSSSTQKESPSATRTLTVIVVGGLVLRLAVAIWLIGQPLYVADERDYDTLASNILLHGQFCFEPGSPISLRPPLFPAIVATIYGAAGDHNFTAVRIFNAAAGALTVVVIYLLARNVFGQKTGIVAAAICAVYPSLVAASGLVLTESVFTLLLCSSCLLMERYLKTAALAWLVGFGAVLGIAALTRSVLWLFPMPLAAFLMCFAPPQKFSIRLAHIAAFLFAFAAVLAPWTIRNTRLQHTFTTVDVMGGRNFMMGNYEHTPMDRPWAAIEINDERAWYRLLQQKFPANGESRTQGQIDKLAMKYAIHYILANPGQTAVRDLAKLGHFWQLEREIVAGLTRGFWGGFSKPGILIAAACILGAYVFVMLLGVFGVLMPTPNTWRTHLFLVLVIGFVCGMHTLVFAHSRYHLPLMPLVGVFAAAAWTARRTLLAHWNQPRMLMAFGVCLLLLAVWVQELMVEAARFG